MARATDHRSPAMRKRLVAFLIRSATELNIRPVIKYSALSLFADRFYPSLFTNSHAAQPRRSNNSEHWLLKKPVRESNLQLFALISLWISSKSHDSRPITVKRLKSIGDSRISEQIFTKGDFIEAERVFMRSLQFEIGTSTTVFVLIEELLVKVGGVARAGEMVRLEACMDIVDLMYETDEFEKMLLLSSGLVAGSVLVAAYAITVPKQRLEFPVLPWVKFVTLHQEDEILTVLRKILEHVLGPAV